MSFRAGITLGTLCTLRSGNTGRSLLTLRTRRSSWTVLAGRPHYAHATIATRDTGWTRIARVSLLSLGPGGSRGTSGTGAALNTNGPCRASHTLLPGWASSAFRPACPYRAGGTGWAQWASNSLGALDTGQTCGSRGS